MVYSWKEVTAVLRDYQTVVFCFIYWCDVLLCGICESLHVLRTCYFLMGSKWRPQIELYLLEMNPILSHRVVWYVTEFRGGVKEFMDIKLISLLLELYIL